MAFIFNPQDRSIEMPCGDTAVICARVKWTSLPPGSVTVFAIFSGDEDLLVKPVEIDDDIAIIRLCNHDTRDIPGGRYKWNIRLVTSPTYDADGNVRTDDCSDDVITAFNSPPTIKLIRAGGYV